MHGVTIDGLIMSRKGDSEVGTSEANIVATRPDAHQKEAATMTIVAMVGTTLGAITSDIDRTAPPTMVVLSPRSAAHKLQSKNVFLTKHNFTCCLNLHSS